MNEMSKFDQQRIDLGIQHGEFEFAYKWYRNIDLIYNKIINIYNKHNCWNELNGEYFTYCWIGYIDKITAQSYYISREGTNAENLLPENFKVFFYLVNLNKRGENDLIIWKFLYKKYNIFMLDKRIASHDLLLQYGRTSDRTK